MIMMHGMEGMGWSMAVIGLLVLILLVLGIAALIESTSSQVGNRTDP